jgi:hypothetical protein
MTVPYRARIMIEVFEVIRNMFSKLMQITIKSDDEAVA